MRIKPHGVWYILPISIVVIGFFIMMYLFFSSLGSASFDVTLIELDEVYEFELEADGMIALYVEDSIYNDFTISQAEDKFIIEKESWLNETQTIDVIILKLPDGEFLEGYDFELVEEDDDDDSDVTNIADFNIFEQGTYSIVFHSEEDLDFEIAVQAIHLGEMLDNLGKIGITILVTIALTFISFLFILIKRSKSKKEKQRKMIALRKEKENNSFIDLSKSKSDIDIFNEY